MSMSNRPIPEDEDHNPLKSITPARKSYDLESSVNEGQRRRTTTGHSRKEKLRKKISSEALWNKLFLTACIIAVSLDPLFFYIPFIDEDQKCLGIDKKLRLAALVLRALTDVPFVVHIVYNLREATAGARKGEKLDWRSTITDILAVFPMPQLLLVFVFFEMRGHGYLERRKINNVFLLGQYLPRIYRIYLSSKKVRHSTGIRAKALLNFFLYILASHVIGAFWYFFSIQRVTSCWYRACVKHRKDAKACIETCYCDKALATKRNVTFYEEHCPTMSDDHASTPFNFGIFQDALKNNITGGDIDFPTKLSYSFWWGLRNISNFGTNLVTSTYVWETCFAVVISLVSLLLFLYLIGNVQNYMSLQNYKWVRKVEDTKSWMERNKLPDDLKKEMNKNIMKKFEEIRDADLVNILSVLPDDTQKCLKHFLCLPILKNVPGLDGKNDEELERMCDDLEPVMYDRASMYFIKSGEPLERMLFITEGTMSMYKSETEGKHCSQRNVEEGEFYGKELIDWASREIDVESKNSKVNHLPLSAYNVKCNSSHAEGFTLPAKKLETVVSSCKK